MEPTWFGRWVFSLGAAALLAAGGALIRFLASPEAAPAISRAGLTPIPAR
jgi:hypothetical protein